MKNKMTGDLDINLAIITGEIYGLYKANKEIIQMIMKSIIKEEHSLMSM